MSQNPSLADVRARRAEIAEIIEPLQAEDKELAVAESVLARLVSADKPKTIGLTVIESGKPPTDAAAQNAAAAASGAAEEDSGSVSDTVKEAMKGNETIEELIVMLLEYCDDTWWTASEVQSHLSEVKGRQISMSTVSPTLWAMRKRGIIYRDGMKVALQSKLDQKNRAAAE